MNLPSIFLKGKKMVEDDATDIVHENTLTDAESSNVAYLSRSKLKANHSGLEDSREERRRSRRLAVDEAMEKLRENQIANRARIMETLNRHCPYTMSECLAKLHSLPDITKEAFIAVKEAITQNNNYKCVLMNLEGDLLRFWIGYVLSCHPKFGKHPAWRC